MDSDGDRRSQPRAPIGLKVEYQRLNTFFADYTRNISRGGTFIRTRDPLPVGTQFVFELVVPQLPRPLTLRGEVRWVRGEGESPTGTEPGMGIQFLWDADEERVAVEEAVERLMTASLGPRLASRLRGR